jgi:hypothetical protein
MKRFISLRFAWCITQFTDIYKDNPSIRRTQSCMSNVTVRELSPPLLSALNCGLNLGALELRESPLLRHWRKDEPLTVTVPLFGYTESDG